MSSEYTFRGLHIRWGDGPMAIVDPGGSTRMPAAWTPAELAIIAEFLVLDDAEQERCLSSTAVTRAAAAEEVAVDENQVDAMEVVHGLSSAAAAEDVAVDENPVDGLEVVHPPVRAPKPHGAAYAKARRQRVRSDNEALDAEAQAELRATVTQSASSKSGASVPGTARHVYYKAPADADVCPCKVGHWHGVVDGFLNDCRFCGWRSGDGR